MGSRDNRGIYATSIRPMPNSLYVKLAAHMRKRKKMFEICKDFYEGFSIAPHRNPSKFIADLKHFLLYYLIWAANIFHINYCTSI